MRLIPSFFRILPLSFAILLTACSARPLRSSDQGTTIPLVGAFPVQRYELENGLRLLVVEDHSSPTFAYQTWFRVGSRDEKPRYTGLAHLFEHMMFKETRNLKDGEFDRILEEAGAEGENAFTNRDYTAYVQEMPKDKLGLIAKLESERMVNLIVNEKAFKTETEVVQNERRFRYENNPDGLMYQEVFSLAFKKHPYRWPVIGYQEDLDRMSATDALEFYRAFYSPNHATIIVTGDVDSENVFSTVKKYYANLPRREALVQAIDSEPRQMLPRRKQLAFNMQVEKLLMGYRIPPVQHPDTAAITVLQAILGGGKSSRLHRALVESGIASGVEAGGLDDRDPSLFLIGANLQKGKKASHAEKIVLRELGLLGRKPVPTSELEKAKNQLEFSFYEGLNANSQRAHFLGLYESVANDFRVGIELHRKTDSVTPEMISALIDRYFNPDYRTVIIGVTK